MVTRRAPEKITDTIAKDTERAKFGRRLCASLKACDIEPRPSPVTAEFNARFPGTNVGIHTVRKWLIGETIPTQEKLVVLAEMLGVHPDWLRFGDAAQRKDARAASVIGAPYSRHELALISDFKRLVPRDQSLVRALLGSMLKTDV